MYEIDRDLDVPLYIQIRDRVVEAIEDGTLQPGDRLPSVCSLAKEIGVTQATIRRALQDLVDAGHTECHVGRGTFIRDASAKEGCGPGCRYVDASENEEEPWLERPAARGPREHAARRLRSSGPPSTDHQKCRVVGNCRVCSQKSSVLFQLMG